MSHFGSEYFKLSPELLCVFDFDGNFIEINPTWKKTLGWTTEEFLKTPFINFVHPNDKDFSMAEFRKLFEIDGYTVTGFENRYAHIDGSFRWLQWSASLHKEDRQVLCSARDVTLTKRDNLLFEETQKVSMVGSWEVDLSNNELYWSKMSHQIHETDYETYRPKLEDGIQYFSGEARMIIENAMKKLLKTGEGYDLELPTGIGYGFWIREKLSNTATENPSAFPAPIQIFLT